MSQSLPSLGGIGSENSGRTRLRRTSGQDGFFHAPRDVGEAEVAPGVFVGEFLVIETEEVEDGGVEVVHVDPSGNGGVAHLVGASMGVSGFGAASGQPGGEAARVVVTSVLSLRKRRAPELATPPDQSVFEQPPLFEILEESGHRFVGGLRMDLVLGHVGVLIPAWIDRSN